MNTRKLCLMGVLSAAALTIFIAEAQIPPVVPIAGVKLGLANIITLTAMAALDRRSAFCVLAVRIILGSMFAGSAASFVYSAAGGLLAFAVMAAVIGLFPRKRLWAVSVLGAIAHNAGQLAAAVWVTGTPGIVRWYAPILLLAGVITGAFTGIASVYLSTAVEKVYNKEQ